MQQKLLVFAALEESQQKEHETARRLLKCAWQLQQQVAALRAEAVDLMKKVNMGQHINFLHEIHSLSPKA